MVKNTARPKGRAWVVAADMGYGHQRPAAALAFLAPDEVVLTANRYDGIPASDRTTWRRLESFYYFASRLAGKGFLGAAAFRTFDYFQRIRPYYPLRRSSGEASPLRHDEAPTLQLRNTYRLIRRGWGRHLIIERLAERPIPLITTFATVAFMAEEWGYPGPIYAVVTDADISRAWAPLHPGRTRIQYCASTDRSAARLLSYGVPAGNIHHTGFPLPPELVGRGSVVAQRSLAARLTRLDPSGRYRLRYGSLVAEHLGEQAAKLNRNGMPLTVVFAIGGAGAQVEIGAKLVRALKSLIVERKLSLHLVAGTSKSVAEELYAAVRAEGIASYLGDTIVVDLAATKDEYFTAFNKLLVTADILWTKPSELSFFVALGIPVIIAPPIGSQEVQNRKWLTYLGAGIDQLPPHLAHEWLPDLLTSGRLAEAAMNGFVNADRGGTEAIARLIPAE